MKERRQWREIDRDRRGERTLVPKAIVALIVVGLLVAIRQIWFA